MPTPTGRHGRLSMLAKAILLVGLLALTVAEATRSDHLEEARRAYERRDLDRSLCRSLDHLQYHPFSHQASVLAARCLSDLVYPDAAEPYYRRTRWSGTLRPEELHSRALGFVMAAKRDEAVAAYEEILRQRPNDVLALRRLATVLFAQQRFDRAKQVAERLAALPEGRVAGYAMLGTVYHEELNPILTIAAYQNVLKADPSLSTLPFSKTVFWTELTDGLISEGRSAEARRLLGEALTRSDDASLHFLLGQAERASGAAEAAEASCVAPWTAIPDTRVPGSCSASSPSRGGRSPPRSNTSNVRTRWRPTTFRPPTA